MLYEYTSLVTVLAIFLTTFFMMRTGLFRGKYKVDAPKMSGHDTFDRAFRVHANTVEQTVMFFPALWLAAAAAGDQLAAGIGAVWLVGRLVYSKIYMKNPAGRAPGVMLTLLPTLALTVLALYYLVRGLIG